MHTIHAPHSPSKLPSWALCFTLLLPVLGGLNSEFQAIEVEAISTLVETASQTNKQTNKSLSKVRMVFGKFVCTGCPGILVVSHSLIKPCLKS